MFPLDIAYSQIRDRIISGELKPGAPLVETSLADEFGVSRTPIREALRRLEQDGLAERVGRRMKVRGRSPSEILEIYEARVAMESAAARSAALRHTEIDRLRIQKQLMRLEEHMASDPDTLLEINHEFHHATWLACHNATMIDVLERLALHMGRLPFTTFSMEGRAESSLEEHRDIAESIFARDPDRAAKAAAAHMESNRELRLKMWEADPDILL